MWALCASNPGSNSNVANADYEAMRDLTTEFSAQKGFGDYERDSSTYADFTLNSSGLAAIDKTGVTKLGMRIGFDIDDDAPTWGLHNRARVTYCTAEETVTGDKRPKLVVTHSSAFTPKAIMF